mmetsp:Transcript_16487/g.55659  ORF Transcript_16487/g.55659 Transcript_16487/m.55659 type:complete len:251 (+) Transcript_16487:692-1444(+)
MGAVAHGAGLRAFKRIHAAGDVLQDDGRRVLLFGVWHGAPGALGRRILARNVGPAGGVHARAARGEAVVCAARGSVRGRGPRLDAGGARGRLRRARVFPKPVYFWSAVRGRPALRGSVPGSPAHGDAVGAALDSSVLGKMRLSRLRAPPEARGFKVGSIDAGRRLRRHRGFCDIEGVGRRGPHARHRGDFEDVGHRHVQSSEDARHVPDFEAVQSDVGAVVGDAGIRREARVHFLLAFTTQREHGRPRHF